MTTMKIQITPEMRVQLMHAETIEIDVPGTQAEQPGQFYIGQSVKKVTGEYKISGVVRSVFTKSDGAVRIVVEHTVKDEHAEGSFLHIYGPSNLEPLNTGGAG